MASSSRTATIVTTIIPLPPSTTLSAALNRLQNHVFMITLNPSIITHRLLANPITSIPISNPASDFFTGPAPIAEYAITDRGARHHLLSPTHFLWRREHTYIATFQNQPQGLRTRVHPGAGVVIWTMWEIRDAASEEGALEVVATARVEASKFIMRLMLPSIRKSHENLVHRFVERVTREELMRNADG